MYLKISKPDPKIGKQLNDRGMIRLHIDPSGAEYYDLKDDSAALSLKELPPDAILIDDLSAMVHPGQAEYEDETARLILRLPSGALFDTPDEDDLDLIIPMEMELVNLSPSVMMIRTPYSMPFQIDLREVNEDVKMTISGQELGGEQTIEIAPGKSLSGNFDLTATGFKGNLHIALKTVPLKIDEKVYQFETPSIPVIVK